VKSRSGCRLQPGELLTRDERLQSYLLRQDLERQLERCTDPGGRVRLERSLTSLQRERQADLVTRRKKLKKADRDPA
jgi:hypothetical protein